MQPLDQRSVHCPYCGERIVLQIDCSAGDQAYSEDCGVCCRPIEVAIRQRDGHWCLEVRRDDD